MGIGAVGVCVRVCALEISTQYILNLGPMGGGGFNSSVNNQVAYPGEIFCILKLLI